jgi:hypothetical protein
MLSCLLLTWGVSATLAFLLAFSEYLSKTKRFKENGILDFIETYLKLLLHKGDQK